MSLPGAGLLFSQPARMSSLSRLSRLSRLPCLCLLELQRAQRQRCIQCGPACPMGIVRVQPPVYLRFALEAFLRQPAVVLRPAVRFQHRRNVERSRGRPPGTLRNQPLRHKLPLVDGVLDVSKDVFGWSCFPCSQEMLLGGLTMRRELVVDPLALALAQCCGNRGH